MISGIILAAGESRRMGTPKALLEFPDKTTLLSRQMSLVGEAGCEPIFAVLGFQADSIIRAHPLPLPYHFIINPNWQRGQFSSIQAGISRALTHDIEGVIILPVDVVGVHLETIKKIISHFKREKNAEVVIPKYNGQSGHPVFISRKFAEHFLSIKPDVPDARLDIQIAKSKEVTHLSVDDPNITSNINTPREWQMACHPSI